MRSSDQAGVGQQPIFHLDRLAIPMTFIHGERNERFLPASTEKTYEFLQQTNGRSLYRRHMIPEYGHIDCIFGKNAVKDVYPPDPATFGRDGLTSSW